jgi:drug/metabolite transporter (DMT)-like permease
LIARTHSRRPALGIAATLIAALLISSKGIFAKLLYARGMDYQSLATLRAFLALPVFWAWALLVSQPLRSAIDYPKAVAVAACAGFAGYYLGALANFYALTLIDAALERVILFSYPAFILLGRWLIDGRRPDTRAVIAVLSTWGGVFLAIGGIDKELLAANWEGALWVLVSGVAMAFYFLANDRVTDQIGSVTFTVFAMSAASLGLTVHGMFNGGVHWPADPEVPWLMAGLILAATVTPLFLVSEGIRLIGAERAAIITTIGPIATMVLAWWVLDELLVLQQAAGALLVISGILVLELGRPKTPRLARPPV